MRSFDVLILTLFASSTAIPVTEDVMTGTQLLKSFLSDNQVRPVGRDAMHRSTRLYLISHARVSKLVRCPNSRTRRRPPCPQQTTRNPPWSVPVDRYAVDRYARRIALFMCSMSYELPRGNITTCDIAGHRRAAQSRADRNPGGVSRGSSGGPYVKQWGTVC